MVLYSVPLGPTLAEAEADEPEVIAISPSEAFGPPTTEVPKPIKPIKAKVKYIRFIGNYTQLTSFINLTNCSFPAEPMPKNKENQKSFKILQELEEGEKILFNDRKTPLTVKKIRENQIEVAGPQGGEYILYTEEDAKHPLTAKPGNKKYSSYAKNLRKVGKWQKTHDKTWQHTKTGAEIKVKKNQAGFYTLETQKFDQQIDLPKYGFSDLENALEEANKIVNENPEG